MKAMASVTAAASSVLAATAVTSTRSASSVSVTPTPVKKSPVPLLIRPVSLHPHGTTLTTPHDAKAEVWPAGSDVAVAHHLGITAYPPSLHEGPEVTAALSRAFPQGSLLAFDTSPPSSTSSSSSSSSGSSSKTLPLAGYIFCFPAQRGRVHPVGDSSGDHAAHATTPATSSSSSTAAPSSSDMSLYLHDIAVYPAYEGRGVAQQLLARYDQLSRSLSLPYQSLTAVHWRGADVFWKSRGFVPLRTFEYVPGMFATYMERPTPPAPATSASSTTTTTPRSAL